MYLLNYQSDHYFHIGYIHLRKGKPCQDHAMSKIEESAACIVVSDGCSSGGETDMASRIMTFSLLSSVREYHKKNKGLLSVLSTFSTPGIINLRQQAIFNSVQRKLGLSLKDMLATCIYGYFNGNGGFINIRGDGVIALKFRNGDARLSRFDWEDNVPLYPIYSHDKYAGFIEEHGGELENKRLKLDEWYWSSGIFTAKGENEMSLRDSILGTIIDFKPEDLYDLAAIAIFTDGVSQIDNYDWKDAVIELLNFKTTSGEFAKRRMMRFLKDAERVGRGAMDDIGYSVVLVNPAEEECQDQEEL